THISLSLILRLPPSSTLFPYTTLFRSGEWVLQTVCEQIKVWQARGITVRPIAVNVSAQQFHQADFDAQVRTLITQSGVDCRLIEDRKSTRLNSSHGSISYAVFCLKKKK